MGAHGTEKQVTISYQQRIMINKGGERDYKPMQVQGLGGTVG